MGFYAPATLPLKIFLQRLVKMRLNWDTLLADDLMEQWRQRLRDFHSRSLSSSLPRLAIPTTLEGSTVELHVFVDASQYAYSAVAYLVCRQPDGYGVSSLLASKARVAPVKDTVTIPRMELLANLLGSLLAHNILKGMTTITIVSTTIWTDSMISLCWIKNQNKKEFPVFVKNRVNKILSLVPTAYFKHVDRIINPADVASRGCSTDELVSHHLWWKGPPFLVQPPETWNLQPIISSSIPKETTMTSIAFDEPIEDPIPSIIDASRFGRWTKMVNTLIFMLIFIRKLKKVPLPSRTTLYRQAENLLFTMAQKQYPPSPHLITQLRLQRCQSTGLWRCRGRINNADMPIDAKNPVFLPRESSITRLFILHRHECIHHFGQQHTLTDIRQRVWIPKGLATVKSALRHCMHCKRKKAKPYTLPEFPDLPEVRTTIPSHPFVAVGMDLAGPLYYRSEDGNRVKYWILLLSCLHTRATYLDLICDMSTRTLLSRIRRFVATNGAPSVIICDNAASFTTLSQLRKAFRQSETNTDVTDYCSENGIEFRFITPFAPWSGGVYERLIGLTKSALKAVIGTRVLPLEELDTLLKECEATLNTRPLTYVGSDIDFAPLRPLDFLRPHASLSLPRLQSEGEDNIDEEWRPRQVLRDTLVDAWTRSTALLTRFWTRWQKEYLTSLREKYQRNHKQGRLVNHDPPKCNDIVLIAEEGLERGQWKLARILSIENDRSAVVKTSSGTLHRPLSLLYKMEIDNTSSTTMAQPSNYVPQSPTATTPTPPTASVPVRRSATLNPTLATLLTIVLTCIPLTVSADSRCLDASSVQTKLIYVTPCSSNGIGIARIEGTANSTAHICWMTLKCPRGHLHLPDIGHNQTHFCGPQCTCPTWTKSCSHYTGRYKNDSVLSRVPLELREFVPSHVCSFKKEEHCAQTAQFGLFSRVELMDGSTFLVPELDLMTSDVYSPDDYRCIDINGMEILDPIISMNNPVFTGSSH